MMWKKKFIPGICSGEIEMEKKKKFLKVYNDYSAIESKDDPNIKTLYHYTQSPEAVVGICKGDERHDSHFRATILKDFWNENEDAEEGRRFIGYLKDYFDDKSDHPLNPFVLKALNNEYKNEKEKYNLDSIIGENNSAVLCTCLDSDLENMWENYAGVQEESAIGYKLVIDKERFLESLYIKVNNQKKSESAFGESIFKFTPIIYEEKKQKDIIEEFVKEFLEASDINELSEMDRVRYILLHSEFLSIAFKNGERFKNEEEYRIWANIANSDENEMLEGFVPEVEPADHKNGKRYYSFYFNPEAITEIVCWSQKAKKTIVEKGIPENIKLTVKENKK